MRLYVAVVVAATVCFGCSPKMFFGDNTDKQVRDARVYRKVNMECSAIDLSEPRLDNTRLRKLVSCLNSNGAMPEINGLVASLSDKDLEPVVAAVNHYILSNPEWMFHLEKTFDTLKKRKLLGESLGQLGQVISNEALITSGLALLKTGYESHTPESKAHFLRALELLGDEVTDQRVADLIDFGLTAARARSFYGLMTRFRSDAATRRTLSDVTTPLLQYLRRDGDPARVDLVYEIMTSSLRGDLYQFIDEVIPSDEESLKDRVPRIASVLKVASRNDGELLGDLSSLFRALRAPVRCLSRTQAMENLGLSVFREISTRTPERTRDFLMRENVLELTYAAPLCDLPPEVNEYYPALMRFAETGAVEEAGRMIGAAYRAQPLAETLVRLLGDTGRDGVSGIKLLKPLFAEIQDRDAWDDVALFATVFRVRDREDLNAFLQALLLPRPDLSGTSIYDVLMDNLSRMSQDHLNDFIRSFQRYVDSDDRILEPALTVLRKAFHSNDVHPGVDILRRVVREAGKNEALLDTLLGISDKAEFRKAVHEASEMAQDGRLEDLLTALTTIFHKFATRGEGPVNERDVPEFLPLQRHDLSVRDLRPFDFEPGRVWWGGVSYDGCKRLVSLGVDLDDYSNPAYAGQLGNLASCLDHDGNHRDAARLVRFIRDQKDDSGTSLAQILVRLATLRLPGQEMQQITDGLLNGVRDGRVSRLLKGVELLAARPVRADGELFPGPVLEPLIQLATPVLHEPVSRAGLRSLQSYFATVLRREGFPLALRYADDLWNATEMDDPIPVATPRFEREEIATAVIRNECATAPVAEPSVVNRRVERIISEFGSAVANTARPDAAGGFLWRSHWEKSELRGQFALVVDRLADPERRGPVLEALLRFMRYFGREAGDEPAQGRHYEARDLGQWLEKRARDVRPVAYVHPAVGQRPPQRRVVLASALDRMEMLLINADIYSPELQLNFAQYFLNSIANAWGDEPYELWPEEIRRKYPRTGRKPKKPPTLKKVVEEIRETVTEAVNLLGPVQIPACGANGEILPPPALPEDAGGGDPANAGEKLKMQLAMANVEQLVTVLEESLPGEDGLYGDEGLRVLRDLFFELQRSNRAEDEGTETRANPRKDNLTLVTDFVRMGLFRQVGIWFREAGPSPRGLNEFLTTLVTAAGDPALKSVAERLLVGDREHRLLWSLYSELYDVAGKPGGWSRLRRTAYFVMASAPGLGGPRGAAGVTEPLMAMLDGMLASHYELLAHNAYRLGTLLDSRKLPRLFESFYSDGAAGRGGVAREEFAALVRDVIADPARGVQLLDILAAVDRSPGHRQAWDRFVSRADRLAELPEYERLDLDGALRPLLNFLELRNTSHTEGRAAVSMLKTVAEHLEKGNFEQLLEIAAREPSESFRVFSTMARYVADGSFDKFLELIQKNFSTRRSDDGDPQQDRDRERPRVWDGRRSVRRSRIGVSGPEVLLLQHPLPQEVQSESGEVSGRLARAHGDVRAREGREACARRQGASRLFGSRCSG